MIHGYREICKINTVTFFLKHPVGCMDNFLINQKIKKIKDFNYLIL